MGARAIWLHVCRVCVLYFFFLKKITVIVIVERQLLVEFNLFFPLCRERY
jgi:hypothetical protein